MEAILSRLKADFGQYVSGEELAKIAGMTRAGIWKYIEQLRSRGYEIESAPHRGYRLTRLTPFLYPDEIHDGLKTKFFGSTIDFQFEVDSTNVRARALAVQGAAEGTVVLAEYQSGGKGRLGRNWNSPPGQGLWVSLVLRPKLPMAELAGINLLTAVAMSRAIREVTGVQIDIKWPNDLVYHGRKLAGILAEVSGEMDRIHYLIVGIGVNVHQSVADFPPELSDRAASLRMILDVVPSRKELLQAFLSHFEQAYLKLSESGLGDVISYARQHSATLGRMVKINRGFGSAVTGEALDLAPDGSLLLRTDDGVITLHAGEIIETVK